MRKSNNNQFLIDVDGGKQLAFVSDYIEGRRPFIKDHHHTKLMGKAMSAFHEALPGEATSKNDTVVSLAEEYINNIKKTYSKDLTANMRASNDPIFRDRADFFDRTYRYVQDHSPQIYERVRQLPSLRGLTHGGLHQENMILTPENQIALIDVDTMKRSEEQWRDVIYANTRLSLSKNEHSFNEFLSNYLSGRELQEEKRQKCFEASDSLKTLIGLNSLHASLYHHRSVFVDRIIDLLTFKARRSEVANDFDDNAKFISTSRELFQGEAPKSPEQPLGGYRDKINNEKSQAGTSQGRSFK